MPAGWRLAGPRHAEYRNIAGGHRACPDAGPAATPAPTASPTTATDKDTGTAKKKPAKKMTRQQEIDKSIDSGTVPSRYRSSVPKEYQQYVPFAK